MRLVWSSKRLVASAAMSARAAGVSPAAPYRHFRDREDLMAEVAKRGFEGFGGLLLKAWDEGRPNAREAMHRLGNAYLAFARNQPVTYVAMFESGVRTSDHPELKAAADGAFAVLQMATDAILAETPAARRPPSLMVALHIWSLSHGIAAPFARGDRARRPIPMPAEELLEAGVLVYLQGLGIGQSGS